LGGLGSGSGNSRRSAVETYDGALVERNDATETRDTGINVLNTDEYGEATDLVADLDDAWEATTICERAVEATGAADVLVRALSIE
jgi:hypothetical protein